MTAATELTVVGFLLANPTAPVIFGSVVVAMASWRSQRRLTRAKNSIDLQNSYLSSERILPEMYQIAEMSKELGADDILRLATMNVALEASDDDKRRLACLRTVLNALERMAIGIRRDVYDADLLYESYASFVLDTWTAFSPYITEKRKGNNRYYENLCWLAVDWATKRDRAKMQ